MAEVSSILVALFVIFLAANVSAELIERVGQPAVVGELLAGVLIGPHARGLIGAPGAALVGVFHEDVSAAAEGLRLVYHVLAELGAIILLFHVGLETRVSDLLRVGPRALLVAVLGIAFPFLFGLVFMVLQPTQRLTGAFTATTLVATSVGITARVMRDLRLVGTHEAQIILGAAVVDDVHPGHPAASDRGCVRRLGRRRRRRRAVASAGPAGPGGGVRAVHRAGRRPARPSVQASTEAVAHRKRPFAVALLLTLGLAALSGIIGLAAIIGAFLAGIALADAREQYQFERQAQPVYQFLAPFFFVVAGAEVNVAVVGVLACCGWPRC